MRRRYHLLDVFTDVALAGNPLAVVHDSGGLRDADMQRIAREFNLSETVFVFEPKRAANTAAVRIFTPSRELPFAGHPTIGAAALMAHVRAKDLLGSQDLQIVLEEQIGDVVCVARKRPGKALAAYFTLPRLPERMNISPDPAALAADLNLAPEDIGFGAHTPSAFSAGVTFLFVPVASAEALARAAPDRKLWGEGGGPAVYLYCPHGEGFRARMFAAGWGIAEDPATGGAAAAFAGVLMSFQSPGEGDHMIAIEQGVEMGRPSQISLGLQIEGGALLSATIGGDVTIVGEGTLQL